MTADELLETTQGNDPLGLASTTRGFELVGVAGEGAVIGYTCNVAPEDAAQRIFEVLHSRGWRLLDGQERSSDGVLANMTSLSMNISGTTLSLGHSDAEGAFTILFVQCVPVPGGSSVIVEVM